MSQLAEARRQKDAFFKTDPQSPLTPEQRKTFDGLKYFPENPALRILTPVEAYENKQVVTLITSTGSAREYLKFGRFSCVVDGQSATLQIYQDPEDGYVFLPFVDSTAPQETYGAGRYLEIEPAAGGQFLIDFNNAYNPYCAYNPHWSCPIPPKENRLKVRIEAGEKKFK